MSPTIRVRGGATAEELAAVVAALSSAAADLKSGESAYERWRNARQSVLRAALRP